MKKYSIHDIFTMLKIFKETKDSHSILDNVIFALLYLPFALWWLDLKLQSGPDALKKDQDSILYYLFSLS